MVSFLRWDAGGREFVLVVVNFTPVPRPSYRLGVPKPGGYRVLLNSDWRSFGGETEPDEAEIEAYEGRWQELAYSLTLDLPPLAILYLTPRPA